MKRVGWTLIPLLALGLASVEVTAQSQTSLVHLKFDESHPSIAFDSSGNGQDGSIVGATRVSSLSGTALLFKPETRVEITHDNLQNPGSNELTLEVVVKPLGQQVAGKFVPLIVKNRPGARSGYSLFIYPDNRVYAFFGDGDERSIVAVSSLPEGEWSHVAATFDGTTSRIYVNHIVDTEKANVDSLIAASAPLEVGGSASSSTRASFNGAIDEVRITDRQLAPDEFLSFRSGCAFGDDFSTFDDGAGWTLAGLGNANQLSAIAVDDSGEDRLALTADGATAFFGADNAGYLYRQISGDFRVEVTIDGTTMTTGGQYRKAGLMVRASLDPWDVRLAALLLPFWENEDETHLQFVARPEFGAPGNLPVARDVVGVPRILDLAIERNGTALSVEYSLDGRATWTRPTTGLGGSVEMPEMPEMVLVGLAMVSNNISVTSTVLFDDYCESMPMN